MTDSETRDERFLDGFIDEWAGDLRDNLIEKGEWGADDFRKMHRGAIIGIARVRQAKAAAFEARVINALHGNVSADLKGYTPEELQSFANNFYNPSE